MSNTADKNIKEKEWRKSNSNIKVYIPQSSVLLNLSTLNFIKKKSMLLLVLFMLDSNKHNPQISSYQIELEEEEYLASSSPGNQFTTDIESNNKDNNAITIIEGLFWNIGYRSS